MSEHYYSEQPQTAHDLKKHEEKLRGRTFHFWTDAGVFSKEGVDFGSRLLIDTMTVTDTDHILDVGCGYGPIGLSAAVQASSGWVTMVDVNERAIGLAKRNAEENGIRNVTIMQSDLYGAIEESQKFSLIVSNPPIRAGKSVVHAVFEGAAPRLKPGGTLWIVIQKKQGAPSAVTKLESLFEEVEIAARDRGYWIIKASQPIVMA
ncbi:class I SAM-dependent methyltransferase [Paenibacillus turpanensis]|uniref:class I SAM-dependent methyltransferase n=1 Tax=Paenibacillus turpanensis TaxID=2689078 RepID=UPI00140C588C|nr:class I SAM-dependent methyltransferase [Paenibacillus turpanensis]